MIRSVMISSAQAQAAQQQQLNATYEYNLVWIELTEQYKAQREVRLCDRTIDPVCVFYGGT